MNIEEIDKWLDNEYGVSYTRLEELHDFVVEQDLKHREEKNKEINRLNNIINELENRDDGLEEFEDWLERQKTRNSEWNNFVMVDGRLGIPISYLLNKLQELKENK